MHPRSRESYIWSDVMTHEFDFRDFLWILYNIIPLYDLFIYIYIIECNYLLSMNICIYVYIYISHDIIPLLFYYLFIHATIKSPIPTCDWLNGPKNAAWRLRLRPRITRWQIPHLMTWVCYQKIQNFRGWIKLINQSTLQVGNYLMVLFEISCMLTHSKRRFVI